jgi:hypothetical protein
MNAQILPSPKTWTQPVSFIRFKKLLWAMLKAVLEPEAPQEPGCSKYYEQLHLQLMRATRLFWLFSVGLFACVLLMVLFWN